MDVNKWGVYKCITRIKAEEEIWNKASTRACETERDRERQRETRRGETKREREREYDGIREGGRAAGKEVTVGTCHRAAASAADTAVMP